MAFDRNGHPGRPTLPLGISADPHSADVQISALLAHEQGISARLAPLAADVQVVAAAGREWHFAIARAFELLYQHVLDAGVD